MSAYEPPTADYPIFDSLAFQSANNGTLTLAEGDIRYLARQNIATSVASLTSFTGGIDTPLINTASTINFTSGIANSNIDIGNDNFTNLFPTKNNIAIGNGVMNGAGLLTGAINNTGIGGSVLQALTGGDRNVAVGFSLATGLTTGSDNVIMGHAAGNTLTTGTNNVILGNASNVSAAGAASGVAIGNGAVASTSTVAIGNAAGGNQSFGAVAIGDSSGKGTQLGNSIAIGYQAGLAGQGVNCIALGNLAGGGSVQNGGAIAIGVNAGRVAQGNNAVAIGNGAGHGTTSAQGDNAIAIGNLAGNASQIANSICLNASGLIVNPGNAGFYVSPVRSIGGISTTADLQPIYYNTTSRELVSGTPTTVKVVGTAAAAAMTTNVAQSLITGGTSITPGTYIVELFCVATTTAVAGNLIIYNVSLSSNAGTPGAPILQTTYATVSVPAVAGQIIGNFTTVLTVATTTTYYLWHLAQFTGIAPTSSPSGSYVRYTRIA